MNKDNYKKGFTHKKIRNFSGGFTLIELLVVIAIISLLFSVVLSSLNSARSKSRDAYRKTQLKQIQVALELYRNSNSAYPVGGWYSSESGDLNSNNGGNWIPGLSPTYISALPKDPRGGDSLICAGGWKSSFHYYSSDGNNYKLLSHCAPEGTMSANDSFYDPVRPGHAWMICSGGTACST